MTCILLGVAIGGSALPYPRHSLGFCFVKHIRRLSASTCWAYCMSFQQEQRSI
jgi:hypothetical protein